MMTSEQCAAARALLSWTPQELSDAAGVSLSTVRDFEGKRREPYERSLRLIKEALEGAGVLFLPENGGGVGVRLARRV